MSSALPPPDDPSALASEIHSLAIHLLRKLRREDIHSGLNAPRLSALSVVVFGGPVTLRDLAAREQVQPPTMTRIVNALEAAGLVRKDSHPGDARSTLITATANGRRLLEEGRERRVRSLAAALAKLSRADQQRIAAASALLTRIVRDL